MLHSRGPNQKWPTKWADWLHHPCRLGGPQCFIARDKTKSVPQVGRGQNQKWPTNGPMGYITPAV